MNQGVVAGIGNYVKAEALWLAKINPHKYVRELSFEELSRLNQAVQERDKRKLCFWRSHH